MPCSHICLSIVQELDACPHSCFLLSESHRIRLCAKHCIFFLSPSQEAVGQVLAICSLSWWNYIENDRIGEHKGFSSLSGRLPQIGTPGFLFLLLVPCFVVWFQVQECSIHKLCCLWQEAHFASNYHSSTSLWIQTTIILFFISAPGKYIGPMAAHMQFHFCCQQPLVNPYTQGCLVN